MVAHCRQRHQPKGSFRWLAKVTQLEPFQVELTDEERPELAFRLRARFMGRKSDKERFREHIPVHVDDIFEAKIPTGGAGVQPAKWTRRVATSMTNSR